MPLARIDDETVTLLIVLAAIGAVVWIVWMIAQAVQRSSMMHVEAQTRENHDRLKALMLQRGMSAEEIERVLDAGAGSMPRVVDPGTPSDPENRIVKVLSDNGYGGDDIDRILSAARQGGPLSNDTAALVETMAKSWAEGADIERVLRGRRPAPPRVPA